MKNILITGSKGFIGKNLVAHLDREENVRILSFNSNNSFHEMKELCKQADVIVHTAGANRPDSTEEFYQVNQNLTEKIVELLNQENIKIPIIFTSSTQVELANDYGISKLKAEEAIIKYGSENNVPIHILKLPNVFGKWCKPNYNSVIATWCHNLARNEEIIVTNKETKLNLIYIDDVISIIMSAIFNSTTSYDQIILEKVNKTTLGELAEMLTHIKMNRISLEIGNMSNILYKNLYSTFLSHLPVDNFSYPLKVNIDQRGALSEVLKSNEFGQIFISTSKPGVVRGNHWHHTKVEKFLVIKGTGLISFRNINDTKVIDYQVSEEKLEVLDIPPGYTHSIENIGENELVTLFWANEIFNPEQTDTMYLNVKEEK